MSSDQGIDALLSSKDPVSDDSLSASSTIEGKLETALLKIGRMEDIDTQLRSQLEKIISQHNQLSAEKAACDIENQHLEAQVELLEADLAGRHNADSTPGSPRDTVESLQADNARLQHQVESATQEVSQLQAQLQHSLQHMCPQQRQDTFSSVETPVESQLRSQISKSEYEVAKQAAQILELQGELTKVQVSYDKSAQRQTEANAQLTRQESTVSRYATSNTHLQDQLQEAQVTAASHQNRITQLESELADSAKSQLEAQEGKARLETEAHHQQELAIRRESEVQQLQARLDESTAAEATAAAADQQLRRQLKEQQEEQNQLQKKYEQEVEGLQASVNASTSKQGSLQAEVVSVQTKAAEQLAQLQSKHDEVQSLQQELESAVTGRAASEHSLSELSARSKSELAEQHDTVKKLQQQLADAQTKLTQMQSDRAEDVQQTAAKEGAVSKHRQEVSDLQAELKKSQKEVASLTDTCTHLQQQLGERTIVLGQKAHQIAHLTAQLNEARALSSSSHSLGTDGKTQQSLLPAQQSQGGEKPNMSSASAAASPMTTPLQFVPAADKGVSDAVPAWSTKGDAAVENSDSPITPLQADPAYPQHPTYTPSESDPSTGAKPSAGPKSGAKHAQQAPQGGAQPVLEGRFDQVKRDTANSINDSNSSTSGSEHSPQQQRRAVGSADSGEKGGHDQAQLSPPQSCPSTPASQIGTSHGSDDPYRSVTHVNSCFDKSDDEGERDDILSSSSKGSQHVATADEANAAVTGRHTDEEDQGLSMSDKMQSRTAVKAITQAGADSKEAIKQVHLLEQRLAESQSVLDTATERAVSAEVDLKTALATLSDAEKVMSVSIHRQEAAELVSVVSGCIAAFVTAAAATVYWLS